jgi:cytochrome b involved in lipid metabolism
MVDFIVKYRDKKYDIHKFLKSHPAGEDILVPYKDKDITEAFDDIGHSKSALKLLNKYFVSGEVVKSEETVVEDKESLIKQLFINEYKYKMFVCFVAFSFAYAFLR